MSARLIKVARETPAELFAPFAMPQDDSHPGAFVFTDSDPIMMLDGPELEAERIIAQARLNAVEIERQAIADARAQVAAEVAAEVARIVEPWRTQLTSTLEELSVLREAISAQAERDLVHLAIEVAKKIVQREVSVDQEIVMTLARAGLSRLSHRTAASIHLHPDDLNFVNKHVAQLKGSRSLELIEDRSIERGGCLIHTEMGDVDVRIDEQFAEIENALLEDQGNPT